MGKIYHSFPLMGRKTLVSKYPNRVKYLDQNKYMVIDINGMKCPRPNWGLEYVREICMLNNRSNDKIYFIEPIRNQMKSKLDRFGVEFTTIIPKKNCKHKLLERAKLMLDANGYKHFDQFFDSMVDFYMSRFTKTVLVDVDSLDDWQDNLFGLPIYTDDMYYAAETIKTKIDQDIREHGRMLTDDKITQVNTIYVPKEKIKIIKLIDEVKIINEPNLHKDIHQVIGLYTDNFNNLIIPIVLDPNVTDVRVECKGV